MTLSGNICRSIMLVSYYSDFAGKFLDGCTLYRQLSIGSDGGDFFVGKQKSTSVCFNASATEVASMKTQSDDLLRM